MMFFERLPETVAEAKQQGDEVVAHLCKEYADRGHAVAAFQEKRGELDWRLNDLPDGSEVARRFDI